MGALIIIISLLCFVALYVILWCVGFLSEWYSHRKDIPIKFDDFKSLYEDNATHFELRNTYVYYETGTYARYSGFPRILTYYFSFTFIDCIRYVFWKRELKKKQQVDEINQKYEEFLKEIEKNKEEIK